MNITVTVNGQTHAHDVEPRLLLVHYLREKLGLTGTHVGCETSLCGACTVHMNGVAVKSCTILAVQADGAEIMTVEGLAQGEVLHPVQEGFWEEHGLQCGFCTPGMIMACVQLLERNPNPTDAADPARAGRQFVPLHWLSAHCQCRAVRGEEDAPGGWRQCRLGAVRANHPAHRNCPASLAGELPAHATSQCPATRQCRRAHYPWRKRA